MALVQSKRWHAGNGNTWTAATPVNLSFDSSVTGGNAVVAVLCQAVVATHTVSDATNGTYGTAVTNPGGTPTYTVTIAFLRNVTGGFSQVSVTSDTTGVGNFMIYEVSELDGTASPITGTDFNASVVTVLNGSATGLSGQGFVVAGINSSSNRTVTDYESGAGYTLDTAATVNNKHIKSLWGSVTSNQGVVTVDTGVAYRGAMAIFPEAATGVLTPGAAAVSLAGTGLSLGFTILMPDEP